MRHCCDGKVLIRKPRNLYETRLIKADHDQGSTNMTHVGPLSIRSKVRKTELWLNLGFIFVLPFLFRALGDRLVALAEPVGLGGLASRLAGGGGWTDIGWEVVAAKALVDPNFSAYATLEVLDPLIGMGWPADQGLSHPPFGIPPFILLSPFDYAWWLPFWICGSVVALALSMRALDVPPWVAYPVAAGVSLTFSGRFSLQTTYAVSALLLALAWRWRHRPWLGGLALAGFGAGRGYGLLLLAYPLLRRRWRLLTVAVGTVVLLSVIAWLFEPSVYSAFLTEGRRTIEIDLSRGDLITPLSLTRQRGLPDLVIYLMAGLMAARMLWLRRHPFWILAWFSFAITPIAWYQSAVAGIPLLVTTWRASTLGRVAVILTAGVFAATTTYMSYSWLTMVVATGLTLAWGRRSNEAETQPSANTTQ